MYKLITMQTFEEQIGLAKPGEKMQLSNSENSSRNPGLRALLSIKNFSATLEKDYSQLIQIENDLKEVNKNGLLIIEENATPGAGEKWKLNVAEMNNAVAAMNDTLDVAKEKITKLEKDNFTALWSQLALHLNAFKDSSKKSGSAGFELLPATAHEPWQKDYLQFEQPLADLVVAHVESCRILLQMIERYTPDELDVITKIIADQVPADFTYEEAVVYQQDYFKALVNFKKEFKEEKNLWDKFLDILAGGTHQPPSERVMLERWIEGEKGDL